MPVVKSDSNRGPLSLVGCTIDLSQIVLVCCKGTVAQPCFLCNNAEWTETITLKCENNGAIQRLVSQHTGYYNKSAFTFGLTHYKVNWEAEGYIVKCSILNKVYHTWMGHSKHNAIKIGEVNLTRFRGNKLLAKMKAIIFYVSGFLWL